MPKIEHEANKKMDEAKTGGTNQLNRNGSYKLINLMIYKLHPPSQVQLEFA